MVNKASNKSTDGAAFDSQYRAAVILGENHLASMPKAASAKYDQNSEKMIFELENGVTLFVPVELIEGLQTNDKAAVGDFDLVMSGSQIHWGTLDVQFYVEDLLKGVFGTPKWMSSINEHFSANGRKGGSSRTTAKIAPSRENGKKGGRLSRRVA